MTFEGDTQGRNCIYRGCKGEPYLTILCINHSHLNYGSSICIPISPRRFFKRGPLTALVSRSASCISLGTYSTVIEPFLWFSYEMIPNIDALFDCGTEDS